MKRSFGIILLVSGLSGCISFTSGQPGAREKKGDDRSAATVAPSQAMVASPGMVAPSMAAWTAHPEHQVPPGNRPGEMPTARTPSTYAPLAPPRMPVTPTAQTAAMPTRPPASAPITPAVATTTMAPTAPVPVAPTSTPAPATVPAPTAPLTPAVASGSTAPPALLNLPPGMPVVMTPRGELAPRMEQAPESESAKSAIRPVAHVTSESAGQTVAQTAKPDVKQAALNSLPTPSPNVKGSMPVEPRSSRPGAPLMRLVNTKRITLNFEVKDVGPSGLSSVELWYTQDCREWKKYDAPTQAQAYVIEVDEEGMYGFTLLAKSGLGLGKEPPAAGDQPQVWVIVDLSRPEVQLTEVTPPTNPRAQQVQIAWNASDKNLGRQPINLYYPDKEDRQWKVIATNLENTGKYTWQVPAGTASFLVKVEATDLAGNVGRAESTRPVLMDTSMPKVSIINVASAPER